MLLGKFGLNCNNFRWNRTQDLDFSQFPLDRMCDRILVVRFPRGASAWPGRIAEIRLQEEGFLSYRLQRATSEENQPNAVEGALAPPNVAVRVQ